MVIIISCIIILVIDLQIRKECNITNIVLQVAYSLGKNLEAYKEEFPIHVDQS